nr:Hsp20/alpha crystallin family protein [uncultured Prevotella sp.]
MIMTPVMYTNDWISKAFNDFFKNDYMPRANATAPAINVKETPQAYVVELAAPGASKEDFMVNINDEGNLALKLERKEDEQESNKQFHYLRREFSYTKYEQTLILPDDVDKEKIAAKVENGVLTINLPKLDEQKVKVQRAIAID